MINNFSRSPTIRDNSLRVSSVIVIWVGASSPSSRACRSMILITRSITATSGGLPVVSPCGVTLWLPTACGHSARSSRSVRATLILRNSSRAEPTREVSRSRARSSAVCTPETDLKPSATMISAWVAPAIFSSRARFWRMIVSSIDPPWERFRFSRWLRGRTRPTGNWGSALASWVSGGTAACQGSLTMVPRPGCPG